MSLLEVKGVGLTLGGRRVLNDVNFSMDTGAFNLVIGPNGAGKSSLLKCVLDFHSNYDGEIFLDGISAREISSRERARILSYVPQFLVLQFNLDVDSFMRLSRFAHDDESLSQQEKIVDACLEQTETNHLKYALLEELSGGERQRVLIAAALAQQPKLLVLDEPSTSLDPVHRRDLAQLLAQLHGQGIAILLVTHDWNELTAYGPRVMALKDGQLVFNCESATLPSHLESLFDCGFHHFQGEGHLISVPRYGVGS